LKVLLLENISAVAVNVFREAGYEVESLKAALDERELVEKVSETSILGVRSKTRITAAVLEAAPKLLAVGAFCIGVDKIDREAASSRGLAVLTIRTRTRGRWRNLRWGRSSCCCGARSRPQPKCTRGCGISRRRGHMRCAG